MARMERVNRGVIFVDAEGCVPGGASKIASGHGAGYLRRGERAIFRAKFPRRGNFASPTGTLPKAAAKIHRYLQAEGGNAKAPLL